MADLIFHQIYDISAIQWQINLLELTVNGEYLPINATYCSLDSSQPLILMTGRDFNKLNETFTTAYTSANNGKQPQWVFMRIEEFSTSLFGLPCNSNTDFPSIGFIFEDYEYRVNPSNLFFDREIEGVKYCFLKAKGTLHPNNNPPLILGQPFLHSFYVQFDLN